MIKLLAAAGAVAALTAPTVHAHHPVAPAPAASGRHRYGPVANEPLSLWDSPIPAAWPLDPSSATEVANFAASIPAYWGAVTLNSMPVFTVPASQPLVPVTPKAGCGTSFATQIGGAVPIPPGAYTTDANYQNDSSIIISQPSTKSVWELWQGRNNGNGTWSACWGGELSSATTNGIFTWPYGLSASGVSYYGTMITEADVASGSIRHTLAMSVPLCNSWVYPAVRGDCATDAGHFSEGTIVKLPASVAMPSGMTPLAQMTFKALQTYGAVVVDYAGANAIQGETTADWAFSGHTGTDPITTASLGWPRYAVFNGMPWSSLEVVDPTH